MSSPQHLVLAIGGTGAQGIPVVKGASHPHASAHAYSAH